MAKSVKAIFAGSFDPITNGHVDIIERAAKMFDKLKIGILINPNKQTMFTVEERVELVKKTLSHIDNVEVIFFEGLLIDFCKKNDISVLVRGIRSSADVDYELQMAHMNKELEDSIETIILPTNTKYSFISSSLIKEVLHFGANIENLVPKCVLEELKKKKIK
ncbi:pantetheine-phosphate adenylyltransferase [Peptostreptococcus faecalis]|uniref:pantetheine-phosphate adenylyltransferase n=1 Tax=Peptostreptococcus faecalis TaxID=2045015 RepID=UPI000C7DCD6E|nr:pantetheine-phosphate adenylyltransferase [Peptostreptococcus faecalis]